MGYQWLIEVAKNHKEWIKIAKLYDVGDYAEDIVQETYIALMKYADADKILDEKGQVRKGYVFFTIKSLCFQYLNKRNKITKIGLDTLFNLSDENNLDEHKAYNDICMLIDKEIDNWHPYDKKLFKLYRDTEFSMRDISKETGISLISIWHSIKNYKEALNSKFMEDYNEYLKNN